MVDPDHDLNKGSKEYKAERSGQDLDQFTMTNESHQYNCFMNAIIQIMWHVNPLREAVLKLESGKDPN